jgi:class 3 adenylate cyclase
MAPVDPNQPRPPGAEAMVDRPPPPRGLADLDELLERRRDDQAAPAVLRALAVLAPADDLAARTLLQALLPGLVRLAGMVGYGDPAAIEEMVSLAWERIRTYPAGRRGSVAANVLFDATAPTAASTRPDRPTPRRSRRRRRPARPRTRPWPGSCSNSSSPPSATNACCATAPSGWCCAHGWPANRSPRSPRRRSSRCPCSPNAAGAPRSAYGNCPWPGDSSCCACAIRDAVRALDLSVRVGVHTGEIEYQGDDIAGIAVHTAARVVAIAAPGEILATSTVRDLAAGSLIHFHDRGTHTLKGVSSPWQLFSIEP